MISYPSELAKTRVTRRKYYIDEGLYNMLNADDNHFWSYPHLGCELFNKFKFAVRECFFILIYIHLNNLLDIFSVLELQHVFIYQP